MSDMSTGRNGGDVYIAVQTQLKFTARRVLLLKKIFFGIGSFIFEKITIVLIFYFYEK